MLCHKRRAVVCLSHEQATASHHDGERLVRESPARGLRVRGQDRVPAFPCPSGRQHVLPFPSPPFREDVDGLHVGGNLPRQEEVVQRAPIDKTDYDWKRYPVIYIDFGNCGRNTAEDLEAWLKKAMRQVALSYGIAAPNLSQHADDVFSDLIDGLSCLGKVVVLIDEYDKVVSDNAFSPEVEKLRQVLGNFYQATGSSRGARRCTTRYRWDCSLPGGTGSRSTTTESRRAIRSW